MTEIKPRDHMVPPRKIIQIAMSVTGDHAPDVMALCDDGTLWIMDGASFDGWVQAKDVPQPPKTPGW